MSTELKPFLVRLTPASVDLLDKAAKETKKAKALIINEAIGTHLSKEADINARLNKISQ
jgi:predicted DNA-binding protein